MFRDKLSTFKQFYLKVYKCKYKYKKQFNHTLIMYYYQRDYFLVIFGYNLLYLSFLLILGH